MFGRRASLHLQRLRWMEGPHGFRTGQRQLLSRCLFVLGRLRHCLSPLETNTNCPLAPGIEMCSWGHVAKNSTACSHEWRAHSTIALVFSTKAWHGQKKGHLLATATNVRVGYKATPTQGGWTAGSTRGFAHIWTNLLNHRHLSEHFAGKCHMETARRVSWHPVFLLVAQQYPRLLHRDFTSMQQRPSMLESSYSSASMTQKQHLVPPDWSHE